MNFWIGGLCSNSPAAVHDEDMMDLLLQATVVVPTNIIATKTSSAPSAEDR
jgi:hypothetical protein